MSDFDETNAGRVPVEGGARVPADNETLDGAPGWPPAAAASAGSEAGAVGARGTLPLPPAGDWWQTGPTGTAHPPPPSPPRRRRPLPAMLTAALVGVTGVAGLGLGHVVWPTTATVNAADPNAIAARLSPALVDVNSVFGYQSAEGAGTGIVLTSNGRDRYQQPRYRRRHQGQRYRHWQRQDLQRGCRRLRLHPRHRCPPTPGGVRAESSPAR
jgi:hypothetical protein